MPNSKAAMPQYFTKENFTWGDFLRKAEHYLHQAPSLDIGVRAAMRPTFQAPAHLARPSVPFAHTYFTFTDEMLEDIVRHPNHYKKDFNTAMTYGFMGNANGGVNGIVRLREEDERMNRRVQGFMKYAENFVQNNYDIALQAGIPGEPGCKPPSVEGVKIVCHRTNGLRTIGIRDCHTNEILFFDSITYKV
jgi:hypothetical protein